MNSLPPDVVEQILKQIQYPVVKQISKIDANSFWVTEALNHVARRSELYLEIDFLPKDEFATVDYKQTRYENCATVNFLNRPNASRPPEERFVELTHLMLKGDETLPMMGFAEVDVDDLSGEEYEEYSDNEDVFPDGPIHLYANDVDLDDYEDAESNEWENDDDRWLRQDYEDGDDYENDYDDSEDELYPGVTAVLPPSPKPKINVNDANLRRSLSLFALRDMTQFKESSLVIDSLTEKDYAYVSPLIDLLSGNFAHVTFHNIVGFGDSINRFLNRLLVIQCVRHLYITHVDITAMNPDLLHRLIKMGSLITFYFSARFHQRVPILSVEKLVNISTWWTDEGGARESKLQQLDLRFTRTSWRLLREKLDVVKADRKHKRNSFQVAGKFGNVTYQLKDGMLIVVFHKE